MGSGSLIRDGTQTPALEVQSLSHWTTREVPAPFKTRVNANMKDLDFLHLFFILRDWAASFFCTLDRLIPSPWEAQEYSHYNIFSVMLTMFWALSVNSFYHCNNPKRRIYRYSHLQKRCRVKKLTQSAQLASGWAALRTQAVRLWMAWL